MRDRVTFMSFVFFEMIMSHTPRKNSNEASTCTKEIGLGNKIYEKSTVAALRALVTVTAMTTPCS